MRHKVIYCIGAIIVVLCTIIVTLPLNPDGRYRNDNIASEGVAYYEFKNGNVILYIPKGRNKYDGLKTEYIGTYGKQYTKWICITTNGYKYELNFNMLSITLFDLTNMTYERYQRIIWN